MTLWPGLFVSILWYSKFGEIFPQKVENFFEFSTFQSKIWQNLSEKKTLTDIGFLEQVHKHKGKWLCPVYFGWSTTTHIFKECENEFTCSDNWFSQDPIKQNDCFWLVTHDDWSRWWHLKSLSPCTFLFMSGAWETINTLCETQNKRNHLISAKFKFHINTNCWSNCNSQHPLPRKKKSHNLSAQNLNQKE